MATNTGTRELATFGGGCFWCLEAAYTELEGIERVVSGYAGGHVANPSYEQVCDERTGHAEVVQIAYDPAVITFSDLLDVFFVIHDPTTPNRQGHDIGTQYRSIVLYHNEEQKAATEQKIASLTEQKLWNAPIVTRVEPLEIFYPAEAYHQDYFKKHPGQPYCQAVVAPKVAKTRKQFYAKLRKGVTA